MRVFPSGHNNPLFLLHTQPSRFNCPPGLSETATKAAHSCWIGDIYSSSRHPESGNDCSHKPGGKKQFLINFFFFSFALNDRQAVCLLGRAVQLLNNEISAGKSDGV